MTDQQIERYSRILSISDTWKFGNRKAALARRDAMVARAKNSRKNAADTDIFIGERPAGGLLSRPADQSQA